MSNDPLEEILKDTPFRMRSNHPGCMAPDGAEPCEHYRDALAKIERLTAVVEAARFIPCVAGAVISRDEADRLQAAFDKLDAAQ